MFKKSVALFTSLCFTLASLGMVAPVQAADDEEKEDEKEAQFVRTISRVGNEGWAIVDVRRVEGKRVVISPLVGDEIDLEESNRYALFQGGTTYTRQVDLPLLRMGVAGFQSAEFMQRSNGKPAIKIQYRSGPQIESRMVNLKDDNDLRRLREYIEHFNEVVKGEYVIGDSSQVALDAEYPQYTDISVAFEERRPRFPVRFRMPGQVKLKDGNKVEGEFVPVFEDNRILIESELTVQRILVDDIAEVKFYGEAGSDALGKAIMQGVGGAAMGALTGAFAAWQANASVKETAIWAAAIFGTFGFVTGLITGARSTRSGETFKLGPVEGRNRR